MIHKDNMRNSKNKKKIYKGKRHYYDSKAGLTISKYPLICPDRMRVKLTWCKNMSLTSGVDFAVEAFLGNSVYDPYIGLNTQPVGFDQWMLLYGKFRVIGSKIIVTMSNQGANPVSLAVWASKTSSTPTTPAAWKGQAYSQFKQLGSAGGINTVRIEGYQSSQRMLGYESIRYGEEFAGNGSSNPQVSWFWIVGANTLDGSSLDSGLYGDVVITYYVEFYDRNSLEES